MPLLPFRKNRPGPPAPKWLRKPRPLDPDEILADSVSQLDVSWGGGVKLERPLERFYSFLFLVFIGTGIFFLAAQSYQLTVLSGGAFLKKSQENRFLVRPVLASRGIIYDFSGQELVENQPSFGLMFDKTLFMEGGGDLASIIEELSRVFSFPKEYFFEIGFPEDYDLGKIPSRLLVTNYISENQLFSIASRQEFFPGMQIFESYRRLYRDSFANSHLVGFVGKVSEEDLRIHPGLGQEDVMGKNGLESFYDEALRGKGGKKIIEVDARGKETKFRLTQEPQAGLGLRTSINADLQRVAYDTLRNYTNGLKGASVVIIDPRDGGVRALVSFPGFDINKFGSALSPREFGEVLKNPLKPLFNRAVSGEFPSGSTIKPLIGVAALEEKIIDPLKKIYDEGFIAIPNPYRPGEESRFLDWKKHGWVDFYDAIAQSANVYFYMIGGGFKDQKGLGIERIKKYAALFGLGSLLGIDLPNEKSGFIPDPETKKITEPQDPLWRVGDTYNVSIGQGGVEVTPLQMTVLTATLANGGKLYRPRIAEEVLDKDGNVVKKFETELIRENMVSEENLKQVVKGMRRTVTQGTAGRLADLPVAVAAKTGTAQAGSGLPHAWVTVFAPVENPEIAMTVMVEHAGEGATVAVPITREILKWYFENRR